MSKNKGITLISLIFVIVIIFILATVSINFILGKNGLIYKTRDAKIMTEASALKEEIDMYITNAEMEDKKGMDKYPVIQDETMEGIDPSTLNNNLKLKMSKWANKARDGDIVTIENIDYSKFYKIDKDKVQNTKSFKGDLYLVEVLNKYKVISMKDIMLSSETTNILVPFNGNEAPQYLTVENNTYKLYGDGRLAVIGDNSPNSGASTEEWNLINSTQELNIKQIAGNTDMAFDENVETDQNIAKINGVKKIYINSKTIYVIDANDQLWAWGDNSYNKLGQGNSYLVSEPTKILNNRTGLEYDVKAKNVWAGPTNTFVLDTNNQLWGAGTNVSGELGQGDYSQYLNFVKINVPGVDFNIVNIEKISTTFSTIMYSSVFIKCDNKETYVAGAGGWGNYGIGKNINSNVFMKLSTYNSNWYDIQDVENQGIITMVLKKNGDLYSAGYNGIGSLGTGDTNNRNTLTKIFSNVKDINTLTVHSNLLIHTYDGKFYVIRDSGRITECSGLIDENAEYITYDVIKSSEDKKLYYVNINYASIVPSAVETNITDKIESRDQTILVIDDKIQIKGDIDITIPKRRSIYQLRNLLNNIEFAQSGNYNLNSVDKQGNIYDGPWKSTEISDIKQVKSSASAKFAVGNDGTLYAKGLPCADGTMNYSQNYFKVTKDGTNYFDNVDKVFPGSGCYNSFFTTRDNKLYWTGVTGYRSLTRLTGQIYVVGGGYATKYPQEVTNLNLIPDASKIVDIQSYYINSAGIGGATTYILDDDGKLYVTSTNPNMSGLGKTYTTDFEELKIKNGVGVKQIVTKEGLSLALLNNGEVYGWGYNTYGILGDGYDMGGIYPYPIKLKLSNIGYLSLGNGFAIFASDSGEVYGIGKNDYGQLGTGNNVGTNNFVRCQELEK